MPSDGPSETSPLLGPPSAQAHHNLAGYSALRFRLTAGAVWSCTFLAAFDSTVLATLTSDISSHFNASQQGSWLGTAYLLSVCCFTPIYGRLADILGRRSAHLLAMAFFTAGTVMCTFAPSMRLLIAARLVAGMGGGGVQSMAVIILTDLVDLRHRGLFQGYANIVFGLGNALGGPVGGLISDRIGWRAAFGVQIPLLVVGTIIAFFCLTSDLGRPPVLASAGASHAAEETLVQKLKRIDYLGSITLVVAVASLILALSIKTSSQTPQGMDYAWSDPLVYGLLLTSLTSTLLFILVEAKLSPAPILPLSLIARRTPAAVAFTLFVTATNQFSVLYNVPLFITAVRLDSASAAGAHLLPYSALIGAGSLAVGWLIRRTGTYWWACVGSGGIILGSSVMLCFWRQGSPAWLTWVAQAPGGFGYAGVLTGTLVALMTDVQIEGKGEVAVATSMSYLFRSTGQVIGVAFSAALVQSILRRDLPRAITGPGSAGVIDRIRHSTDSIRHLPAEQRDAAAAVYAKALRVVFVANLGLALLAMVGLAAIREESIPERKSVRAREEESREGGVG